MSIQNRILTGWKQEYYDRYGTDDVHPVQVKEFLDMKDQQFAAEREQERQQELARQAAAP